MLVTSNLALRNQRPVVRIHSGVFPENQLVGGEEAEFETSHFSDCVRNVTYLRRGKQYIVAAVGSADHSPRVRCVCFAVTEQPAASCSYRRVAHLKFFSSSVLPVPEYTASCG